MFKLELMSSSEIRFIVRLVLRNHYTLTTLDTTLTRNYRPDDDISSSRNVSRFKINMTENLDLLLP